MNNHDDKYLARAGFEPGTPRLQAPVDTNEPSGPTALLCSIKPTTPTDINGQRWRLLKNTLKHIFFKTFLSNILETDIYIITYFSIPLSMNNCFN